MERRNFLKSAGAGVAAAPAILSQNKPGETVGVAMVGVGNGGFYLMTEFQNMNFGDDQYRVAGEYLWNETFFLRGGYQLVGGGEANADTYIFGPAFGGGVKFSLGTVGFQVDYAYQATEVFKGTNTVSVLLNF